MDLPSDMRPQRCDSCGRPAPHAHEDRCEACGEVRFLCAFCANFEPFTNVLGFCSECHDLMLPAERECAGPLEE